MAATALAQRSARASRAAPARRPVAAPRPAEVRRPRAARTATAISEAADSRLLVRVTHSQAWIAIVGVLLAGIVALNVYSLGMSAAVSATAEQAGDLERENSILRERIGKLRRNGEIERFAAKLGLGQPTSEELVRVAAKRGDAARAAERLKALASGTLAATTASAPVGAEISTVTEATAVEPAAVAPEVAPEAAVADPATAAPASTAPEPSATTPEPTVAPAGGVSP